MCKIQMPVHTRGIASKRFFMPAAMREYFVRSGLQHIYAGIIGSKENARLLVANLPGPVDARTLHGNDFAQKLYVLGSVWLGDLRELALDDKVFNEQVLEPVRSAARFIIKVRNITEGRTTTEISALVFAKSRSRFSKSFKDHVTTLSVIIPELECVMAIKCRSDLVSSVSPGSYYHFHGVQPVPYVNRMHPSAALRVYHENSRKVKLSELGFLKTSFHDLKILLRTRSFALENFCIMESFQENRKRLGAPCVFSGTIHSVSIPNITIKRIVNYSNESENRNANRGRSLSATQTNSANHGIVSSNGSEGMVNTGTEDETVTMCVTQSLLSALGQNAESRLNSLRGKTARFLGVYWFGRGQRSPPELFMIEEENNISKLISDDIEGFTRIRGALPLEQLRSCFAPLEEVVRYIPPAVSVQAGMASWKSRASGHDQVTSIFLKETRNTANLRQKLNGALGIPGPFSFRKIFDVNKMSIESLARFLQNDSLAADILFSLAKNGSSTRWKEMRRIADLATVLCSDLRGQDREVIRAKLEWMRLKGLILKDKLSVRMTEAGLTLAYILSRNRINTALNNLLTTVSHDAVPEHMIFIPDLERSTGIPRMLLIEALLDPELHFSAKPLRVNGKEYRLFWITATNDMERNSAETAIEKKVESLAWCVHRIIADFQAPAKSEAIRSSLAQNAGIDLDKQTLDVALSLLQKRGQMEFDSRNGNWSFPWLNVISSFLAEHKDSIYTVGELIKLVPLPRLTEYAIETHFRTLTGRRHAAEVLTGVWTHPDGLSQKKTSILKTIVRESIILELRSRRTGMPMTELSDASINKAYHLPFDSIPGIRHRVCNEAIAEMISKGEIVKDGEMCRLQGHA